MTPAAVAMVLALAAGGGPSMAQPAATAPSPAAPKGPSVTISMRGTDATVSGELAGATAGGVLVRASSGATVWYSWDRVRADAEPALRPFAELSESALRARGRVERGDLAMAERELGRMVELMGEPWPPAGPTGSLCAEGLARCRLARGWRIGATWSWLAWTATRTDVGSWARGSGTFRGEPFIDPATGLCPQLPPIYSSRLDGDAIRASADAPEWTRLRGAGGEAGATGQLAELYHAAMTFEATDAALVIDVAALAKGGGIGVQLVADVVASREGDPEARRAARERLQQRIEGIESLSTVVRSGPESPDSVLPAMSESPRAALTGRWVEAWARAALGRSMLMEADLGVRRMGVLELLHLPARFGDILPGLAALCLTDAAAAMESMGDAGAAARLREDLDARFLNVGVGSGNADKASKAAPAPSKKKNEQRNR